MKNKSCYQCKHRGDVVGSAHSKCLHPIPETEKLKPLLMLQAITRPTEPLACILDGIGVCLTAVRLNEHGVKNGWALWPVDFDPVWVEECILFETKKETP